MKTIAFLVASISLLVTSAYADESLCSSGEDAVLSCQTKQGKIISVCSSSYSSAGAKVIYRFGTKQKTELELLADTSQKSPPIEHNATSGARGYDYFVRFSSGNHTYTVQDSWNGCPMPGQTRCPKDSSFAGVKVAKSNKLIARYTCVGAAGVNQELLSRLGIPVSENWPE